MKTNFQMIREIKDYTPKSRFVTSQEEIEMLKEHFGLDKMSVLELCNLRDMVVMMFTNYLEESIEVDWEKHDKQMRGMQSITAVIDAFKYKAGAEV